jgi:hypothetical protein
MGPRAPAGAEIVVPAPFNSSDDERAGADQVREA